MTELRRTLARRINERHALLDRAMAVVSADRRINAAWVGGSIGRDSDDALSDIDLHLAADDDDIAEVCAERHAFAGRIESPLLLMEAPQNNPPGGGFLISLYDRPDGPQQLDWNFHAQSRARIASATHVLLERAAVPRTPESELRWDYQPIPELTPTEQATHEVTSFWTMLLITAKMVARRPDEPEMPLLVHVVESLRRVRRFLDPGSVTEDVQPAEKLRHLRDLAVQMEKLMPQVAQRGCALPTGIVPAADRYLGIIEQIVASGQPPSQLSQPLE